MKVIVSAAGTGGHINPGIAIANKIMEEEPNSEIVFFGTPNGLENDLVPRAGYKLKTIEAYGIESKSPITNLKLLLKTMKSTKTVKSFIEEFKPDVVIGTGGYICGPVFWAANSKKIPTILHESNAFPGRAVKLFAKKADKVLLGFEEAKDRLPGVKNLVVTGTPTKIKKLNISELMKKELLHQLGLNPDLPTALVFGGSQGAKKINDAVTGIVIKGLNKDYQFIWATGATQFNVVKDEFKENHIDIDKVHNAKAVPYIYNMEELLNATDLVICRSGAMTITEISIAEKPAIFIPLPSMRANRQEDNARVLEHLNAAKVILNEELNSEILHKYIEEIVSNKTKMLQMGKNAGSIAITNVENKIYKEIKSIVKSK